LFVPNDYFGLNILLIIIESDGISSTTRNKEKFIYTNNKNLYNKSKKYPTTAYERFIIQTIYVIIEDDDYNIDE